ncbi:MAG: cytochrome P450, partial [Acidimicrobiales bacterium]
MSHVDLTDLTSVFVDPNAYADEERFHAGCRVLRHDHPVVRVESDLYRPLWAITRHSDVLEIERDHEHFRDSPRPLLALAAVETLAEANRDQALR